MTQRAPYRCEAFDCECIEMFGTIYSVAVMGAAFRFLGWDERGNVAWDTANPTTIAAAIAGGIDSTGNGYRATVGPLPAIYSPRLAEKTYRWEVRRVDAGGQPVLVWGFLTITPSPPSY